MKKSILTALLIVAIIGPSFAQEGEEETTGKRTREKQYNNQEMRTLFGRNRSNGGYGALWMGYSTLENKNALQFGARGSWVIQHSFAIGFGGTGFLNEYHYDVLLDKDVFLTGGYGGIYLEPIIFPRSPVHLAFPVLLGAGGISFVSYNDASWDSNFIEDYEAFLIVEPGVDIELNLTRLMRVGFGTTYRFPTPFNVGQAPGGSANAEALRGFTYNVTFKFGSF